MNRNEARYEAFKRAHGALQAYIDGGAISEQYQDYPQTDILKIEKEFQCIMDAIWSQTLRVPKSTQASRR